jgi:hypothetical protein
MRDYGHGPNDRTGDKLIGLCRMTEPRPPGALAAVCLVAIKTSPLPAIIITPWYFDTVTTSAMLKISA